MTQTTWLIREDKLPMILNSVLRRNGHYPARKETKDWRTWARDTAIDQDEKPFPGPVVVTVTPLRKNGTGTPDVGAQFLAAKGMIDGLVDAGVLPKDTPDVVKRLVFEEPQIGGTHGMKLVVREFDPN